MIRNLTPHPIVLAPSDDPYTWVTIQTVATEATRIDRDIAHLREGLTGARMAALDDEGAHALAEIDRLQALRDRLGPATAARVASTPGKRLTNATSPVPLVEPTVFGALEGLPESVRPDDLLIVSLVCAQVAAREAADLETELAGWPSELTPERRDRLAVLRACVSPGQGRDVIQWTAAHVEAGLCPPTLVGLTRAVRALVFAVR